MEKARAMEGTGLGARLLAARRAAALSTRAVAERLQRRHLRISHATIANYESGKTRPPLPLVAALADLYGKPVNWFLQSGPVLTGVRYRSLKSVSAARKHRFEAVSQRWLDAYRELERALDVPFVNQMGSFQVGRGERGGALAVRLRRELGLEDDPVPSVVEALERFGIRVIEVPTEDRIDGLAGRMAGEKVAVLNAALPSERIRLNGAHELGHHLYKDAVGGRTMDDAAVEKRAFEFASHFLLPESQLVAALEGYSMLRLVEFKQRFGVSLAAMIYRAKKVKLITDRVYRRLWVEFSKRGWRKKEPGTVLPERATRFEKMLETAIRSQGHSWPDVSRMTGIREDELRERLASAIRNERGGG